MNYVSACGEHFVIDLEDDDTLDTVVKITDEEGFTFTERYSQEYAADYRDEDGVLDLERFVTNVVSDCFYG